MLSSPRAFLALLLFWLVPAAVAAPGRWADAINAYTSADLANPPPRHGVVFIGSSSILRWTTLSRDFPGVPVINRGFGGSELADSVFYADRIVTPYQPRVVVLYAGENDLWAGKSPEAVQADFRAFGTKVHAVVPTARIVFIAIKPSPSRERIRIEVLRANALIAVECARDRRLVFVDVYSPMLDAAGKERPELYVADMLHMNEAGYAVWIPLVAPHLR